MHEQYAKKKKKTKLHRPTKINKQTSKAQSNQTSSYWSRQPVMA